MLAKETLKTISKQAELLGRAATFEGRPREQIVALGEAEEVFFRLYPCHYRALQVVRVASQLAKVAVKRQQAIERCENRLISSLMKVLRQAICRGDLQLVSLHRAEEVAFVLWALAFGTRALMDTTVATGQLGITDSFQVTRQTLDMLLDSLGWQPLSSQWDYQQTRRRIRLELFSAEWEELSRQNAQQR